MNFRLCCRYLLLAGCCTYGANGAAQTLAMSETRPGQMPTTAAEQSWQQPSQSASQQIRHEIDMALSGYGPYSPQLGQLYASLGSQLQNEQDHLSALGVFKSAMHVERINQGLYSSSQEHILDAMVRSALALKDWQLADDFLHHWQWLADEHGSNGPDAYLRGVRSLAREHLNAFFGGNSLSSTAAELHIVKADYWFTTAVNSLDQHGQQDQSMLPWLQDITLTAYYLSLMSAEKKRPIEPTKIDGEPDVLKSNLSQANFLMEQYRKGKDAIERMIEIHIQEAQGDIHPQVEAEILLADWYQLYNRPESAKKQYNRAYDLLLSNLNYHQPGEEIVRMPVGLPEVESQRANKNALAQKIVIRYDVSWRGNASNLTVLENPGIEVGEISDIKQAILGRKYRPKLINGVATDAQGVIEHFPIP